MVLRMVSAWSVYVVEFIISYNMISIHFSMSFWFSPCLLLMPVFLEDPRDCFLWQDPDDCRNKNDRSDICCHVPSENDLGFL